MHSGMHSGGVGRAALSPGSLAADLRSAEGTHTYAHFIMGID